MPEEAEPMRVRRACRAFAVMGRALGGMMEECVLGGLYDVVTGVLLFVREYFVGGSERST